MMYVHFYPKVFGWVNLLVYFQQMSWSSFGCYCDDEERKSKNVYGLKLNCLLGCAEVSWNKVNMKILLSFLLLTKCSECFNSFIY